MSRKVSTVANTDVNAAYPDGGVRDEAGLVLGTPLVEALYHDALQVWHRLMRLAGITYNGLADNETNGYQFVDALNHYIRNRVDASTTLKGVLRIATTAEARAKTSANTALTPEGFAEAAKVTYITSAGATQLTTLLKKVIEIGDWNMLTTGFVDVTHGLTPENILSIQAFIRIDDAPTSKGMFPINYASQTAVDNGTAPNADGISAGTISLNNTDPTKLRLGRTAAGFFASASFNATSYNRGYVIIEYIAS